MQRIDLEMELHDLVCAARAGDGRAYSDLLRAAVPVMRRAAIAQLARFGRAQDSEDVVQEALIAIHLKLHTYDQQQRFLPWLRAVVSNKLIDFLRRNRIRSSLSLDDDDSFFDLADDRNPEEGMIKRDVSLLLAQLKPPAGEIVYALKVEGASVQDVARAFKLTESNVKVIVHRAMAKLAQLAMAGQEKKAGEA